MTATQAGLLALALVALVAVIEWVRLGRDMARHHDPVGQAMAARGALHVVGACVAAAVILLIAR
jgi:hypothetical protein